MTSRRTFLRGLVGACCGLALAPRLLPLLEPVAPVVDPLQFATFAAIKRIVEEMRRDFLVEPFLGQPPCFQLIVSMDAMDEMMAAMARPVPASPEIVSGAENKDEI